jgi:hypothetical protein
MYRILFCLSLAFPLLAEVSTSQTVKEKESQEERLRLQRVVTEAKTSSDRWLDLLDQGFFEKAWDEGSSLMQQTINKEEFEKFLTSVRKPLGKVITRKFDSVKMAKDPADLPAGTYIVVSYKTIFPGKSNGVERVTLYQVGSGPWQVLTYNVK